jgi:hypothetical protein
MCLTAVANLAFLHLSRLKDQNRYCRKARGLIEPMEKER